MIAEAVQGVTGKTPEFSTGGGTSDARFIKDGGYENPDWWSEEGWQWRMKPSGRGEGPTVEPGYWHSSRYGRERRGNPVVGVSGYEAEAYCNWLSAQLREGRQELYVIGEGRPEASGPALAALAVRLPTEGEWSAFCGGEQGERYPWDPPEGPATTASASDAAEVLARANVAESGLDGPSPVAMYPLGKSRPYGLMELAGNVWEWTAPSYVLRGAAYYVEFGAAGCGARADLGPDLSDLDLGFRVVSPISPSGS